MMSTITRSLFITTYWISLLVAPLAVAEPELHFQLSGRIVDGHGLGVPDVAIQLQSLPAARVLQTGRTDDEGFYHWEVDLGLYRVSAELPTATWTYEVFVDHPQVLPPLLTTADLDAEPNRGPDWIARPEVGVAQSDGFVEGRVVESRVSGAGSPLAGAWCWVEGFGEAAQRSNVNGVYRLPAPQRRGRRLQVVRRGFLPARVPAPSAEEGEVVRGWTVSLHRAGYLQGKVTDDEGTPLPAEVKLQVLEAAETRSEAIYPRTAMAHVDRHGDFVLPVLPGEEVELSFTSPGHSSQTLRLRTPEPGATGEAIRVELPAQLVAGGEVRHEDGRPIPNAIVTAVPWGDDSTLRALLAQRKPTRSGLSTGRSATDGRFILEDLSAGSYSLVVTANGFEPVAVTGIQVEPGPEMVPLGTVFLKPANSLHGLVVNPQGDPVPGASIFVSLLDATGRTAQARSGEAVLADESGEFTVSGLAGGTQISLTARRTGFLPNTIPAVQIPTDDPVVVELEPAAAITGRVTNATGEPVSGATVTLRPTAERGNLLRQRRMLSTEVGGVVTDAEGLFSLREVEPGSHWLKVVADCCLPAERRVEAEIDDNSPELTIRLEPGLEVRGLVLTSTGNPVTGALVTTGGQSSHSGGDGRFVIRGLAAGVSTLEATHPDHGQTERRIEVGRDDGVEIRFAEATRLTGRVLNMEGRAISGANVRIRCGLDLFGRPLRTKENGHFGRIVQPGSCSVTASAPGYRSAEPRRFEIEEGETKQIVLTLDRGVVLRGRLLGADTFELAHVNLSARAPGRTPLSGRVEPGGDFEIAGLDPGNWRVVASLADGRRADTAVEIVEGQREAWADLELDRGHDMHGQVTLNGEPLAGAWITVSSLDGQPLARSLAGPNGEIQVLSLSDARVQLDVASPDGSLRWSQTVEPGTAPVAVEIWTGSLRGQVTEESSGLGAAGVSLSVEPLGNSTWLPTPVPRSGPQGRFGPWRLAEGRYRLTARASGYPPSTLDVDIQRGAELVVELPLKPGDQETAPPGP